MALSCLAPRIDRRRRKRGDKLTGEVRVGAQRGEISSFNNAGDTGAGKRLSGISSDKEGNQAAAKGEGGMLRAYQRPRLRRMQRLTRFLRLMFRFQNIEIGSRARTKSASMFSAAAKLESEVNQQRYLVDVQFMKVA